MSIKNTLVFVVVSEKLINLSDSLWSGVNKTVSNINMMWMKPLVDI